MTIAKHHNHDYDGGTPNLPKGAGDRYYAQDLGRDLNYLRDQIGLLAGSIAGAMPFILSGGIVTKGSGDTLNITLGTGYVKQSVAIPNDSTSPPASVMSADIEGVPVSWTAQTNMAIASAVLDGSTPNYVKVQYAETNSSNRNRAKKAGAYPVEKIPSFAITVNMVAPTVYDICLAQFTGTVGGAFTITAGSTPRGTLISPKINEDVAVVATATAINNGLTPIGTIIMGGMINTPTNYLYCDGSTISRSTYSALYDVVTLSKGTCTISNASPGVVTLNSHGLLDGDCFELTTTGGLPTGLSVNTNYYVYKNDVNSFWVCPTYADAIGHTNRVNTSSAGSGTHTLRYCPYGISTSANFLLPNFQAVVPKGIGSQTINTRAKTAPAMGQVEEDQMHDHLHGLTQPCSSADDGAGGYMMINSLTVAATPTFNTGGPLVNGGSGTPRVGMTTRENSIGVKYYIKYQ